MRKSLFFSILFLSCISMVFATYVTNTNQSTSYLRLLNRNASTDIDAVYYNPAGLTQLSDGWHIALHNQTIFQEKTVVNGLPFLNNSTYVGEVNVPFFPNFYAAYKADNFTLSFGFGPNSGGGSANYATGLPSFETSISLLPVLLSSMGLPTTQYSVDLSFDGKSVYYGFQANASYALSDIISVAGGVRYISAVNTYEGSIKNIMINPKHPLINPTGGMMSAAQFFTIAGMPTYAAIVKDMSVDVKQTGSGFTPILGMHLRPSENLNIGIRYEFNTKLELTNETTVDDSGLYPDGEKSRNDIPAILALGLEYALVPEFRVAISYSYYFDKNANWDGREDDVESNTYDVGIGIEYDITDSILFSVGYLRTKLSPSEDYQSDLSHELSSHSVGAGARIKLHRNVSMELAGIFASYQDADKMIPYAIGSFEETYKRTSKAVSVGFNFHF